jgi:hypothetical protein
MFMKKILILLSVCSVTSVAAAGTEWWTQDTICRPVLNKCYTLMGTGYNTGFWDKNNSCWGMKYVCGNAIEKTEKVLADMGKIQDFQSNYTDFDFASLDAANRCFGVRKTKDNGSKVMVKGNYVNVYCKGVIDDTTESTANGEITLNYKSTGDQPTCRDLANNGWLKTLNNNNKCYGKKYPLSDYFIECDKNQEDNTTRVIVLNGSANYLVNSNGVSTGQYPVKTEEANKVFDEMITVAKKKHYEKFVEGRAAAEGTGEK